MTKTLAAVMKRLPKARRAQIEVATAREAAQIMSLRDLRKAFNKSQEALAKDLGIEQETVSRIERRADLLLSTLRKYVEAMGGELKLVAEFPGQAPSKSTPWTCCASRNGQPDRCANGRDFHTNIVSLAISPKRGARR